MVSGASSDQPGRGSRRLMADKGGFFFSFRGPDAQAQMDAAMRDVLSEEEFEHWRRSRELSRHPRPLTDMERGVVREAAAPLLRDLAASGMPLPDIREEAHEDRNGEAVCAWIQGPGGTGQGIWIWLDSSPAELVAELAEQLQDWAADQLRDSGRPPEWPECPEHPAAPHRLSPEVRDAAAVWVCWETGHVIWEIGALVSPGARAKRIRNRDRRA